MKIDGLEWSKDAGTLILIVGAQRYVFTRNDGGDLHYEANCASCGNPFQAFYRQGKSLSLSRRCQFHKEKGTRVSKQRDSFA